MVPLRQSQKISSISWPWRMFETLSKIDITPTSSWWLCGVIHCSFLESKQRITVYCQHLDEIHIQLSQMPPARVDRQCSILHHDNVRPHIARTTLQKLIDLGFHALPNPPYSPDPSATDYHIFLGSKHLKSFNKGIDFFKQINLIKAGDLLKKKREDYPSRSLLKGTSLHIIKIKVSTPK